MGARQVDGAGWSSQVLGSDRPVVVEITASWFRAASQLSQAVDELADAVRGHLEVVRLDIDREPETARRYGITSVPTVLVFEGGAVSRRLVGARGRRRLLDDLADLLP